MPKDKSSSRKKTSLRAEAEKRLSEKPRAKYPHDDPARLIHELEVHQIELEMQNEELQRALLEIEKAKDKYADFYDFAPVGYVTLDDKGIISEANLTAARFLGLERKYLVSNPFSHFIHSEFQDTFHLHSREALQSSAKQTCELVLKKHDGTLFHAQLDSIGVEVNGERTMRAVLTDITDRKRAEENTRHLASFPQINPNPVIETDASGAVTFSNRAAQNILGYLGIGKNNLKTFLPGDFDAILKKWDRQKESVLYREVTIADRVFGQTVHLIPQFKVARIYSREITKRKQAEVMMLRQNKVLEGINRIFQEVLSSHTEEELGQVCLAVAEEVTRSNIGFIGQIGSDGYIHATALSDRGWEACKMMDPARQRKLPGNFEIHGIYGRVLKDRKGFFTNDPASHPDWIGLPSGHPPLTAFLGVPLIDKGRTMGMIALANRDGGYTTQELEAVESLAPAIVEAFRRKQAEQALQKNEEKYRNLFETVIDGVFIADAQGRFLEANKAACRQLGYSRDELLQLSVLDISTTTESAFRETQKRIGTEHFLSYETAHRRKDGTIIPIELVVTDIQYEAQRALLGVARDITDRKQAENHQASNLAALTKMHDLSIRVLEAAGLEPMLQEIMDAAVFMVGAEKGTLQLIEGNSLRIVAHCGHERSFLDFFAEAENVASVCGEATKCAERVIVEDVETSPILAGTQSLSVLRNAGVRAVQSTPLVSRNGGLLGILTTQWGSPHVPDEHDLWRIDLLARQASDIIEHTRDQEALQKVNAELERRVLERTSELNQAYESLQHEIDEHKKTEEQLRQAQKMEAIGTLAGGIAHDFNNILASILGFTEMAIDDVPDRPVVERSLQYVLKSTMRARELVKQILAFSRKTGYMRSPVSLFPLITETVQFLRASIPATVKIVSTMTATSDVVLAAPVEVQQILMNLATNASLAMAEKGGTLEVGLADINFGPDSPVLEPDVMPGEYVQLMVRDTGVGISPDVMRRIFEPFFTTRGVGQGTGMGLAVAYGLVKSLHGMITVESEPGKGSTFRVSLPKVKAATKEEQSQAVPTPGGRESILFVDDEGMLVELGQARLERLGYSVKASTDAAEALKAFSSDPSRFDLVITDQTMHSMTGVQLARELLRIKPDIPIILCTGHSDHVSPETATEMGIKQFLTKPVTKQELAEAVRRVLDEKTVTRNG